MSDPARWAEVWEELGLCGDPALHAELRRRYAEPQRAYHTLQHITECLDLLQQARGLAQRPAEVELAIWFHDAIYDTSRHDNEQRSAEWARHELCKAGASDEIAGRVHELVMVNWHAAQPVGENQCLLSDIDLAILGAPPSRFDEYERQVREEYQHVPMSAYKAARSQVLQGFLSRPRIYLTDGFHERREQPARANIERSLRQLS